jgi:hypothetical protein
MLQPGVRLSHSTHSPVRCAHMLQPGVHLPHIYPIGITSNLPDFWCCLYEQNMSCDHRDNLHCHRTVRDIGDEIQEWAGN